MRKTMILGRVIALAAAWAGLSCDPPTTSDPGEVFLTMRSATMGCPEAGSLWSVTIRVHANAVYTIAGTWLSPTDPGNGECFEPRLPPFECVYEVPFEARVLAAHETEALHSIIDDFPRLQAEVDTACDPCGSIDYTWADRTEGTVCTVEPDPAYHGALLELYVFLRKLALGDEGPG